MLLLAKVVENHIVQLLQTQLSPGKNLSGISIAIRFLLDNMLSNASLSRCGRSSIAAACSGGQLYASTFQEVTGMNASHCRCELGKGAHGEMCEPACWAQSGQCQSQPGGNTERACQGEIAFLMHSGMSACEIL